VVNSFIKNRKIVYVFFINTILILISSCYDNSKKYTNFNNQENNRFSIVNKYIYEVNKNYLMVYEIVNADTTKLIYCLTLTRYESGKTVKNIFSYKNYLLFSTNSGVLIYNLKNPEVPEYVSEINYMTSRYLVVTNDVVAYLILNSDLEFNREINQLDIIDIRNISQPKIVKTIHIPSLTGLSLNGDFLFVFDFNKLIIFDIENPYNPEFIQKIDIDRPNDIITKNSNNNLIITSLDGIYQFDYSDSDNLKLDLKIKIHR